MYASELNRLHIGLDLTLTIGGICTGGIIESVGQFAGMVSVNLDGQIFNIDEDMPVILTRIDTRQQMLTEPNPTVRQGLYATFDARGVRA
jgi:hypothetical protein